MFWDVLHIRCVWFPDGGPGHVQQDVKKKTLFKNKPQGDTGNIFKFMTEATDFGA